MGWMKLGKDYVGTRAGTARHEISHAAATLTLTGFSTFVVEIFCNDSGHWYGCNRPPELFIDHDDHTPTLTNDSPLPIVDDSAPDLEGHLDWLADPAAADGFHATLLREATISYAGVAGECWFTRCWSIEHAFSSWRDREKVAKSAQEFGRDLLPGDVWWTAYDAAIRLVDRHWGWIWSAAKVLEERQQLSASEVLAIRDTAQELKNWWRGPAPTGPDYDTPLRLRWELLERAAVMALSRGLGVVSPEES